MHTQPDISDWIGRTEIATDRIDLRPAMLMQSVVPSDHVLHEGAKLPPLWNWLYFHSPSPLEQLGRDGHAAKGGFLPPTDLPRRMWAGGRFRFHGDLCIGDQVTRRSEILNITPKTGRSGRLCFVTVGHHYIRDDQTLWHEEHDIVYRDDPLPDQPAPLPMPAPTGPDVSETITPSIVMLFRYSALTFNGHRIHYDRSYVREVEGYPDLVFHGPLTATLLAGIAQRCSDTRMVAFDYRAVAPLFDTAPFQISAKRDADGATAWATTPQGALAMQATARFE
ncbi:MAG: MaoC family dehydratase N-terminal domain-containing protein [Paracoccaceae bacterium]